MSVTLSDQEIIRKAVELADGWSVSESGRITIKYDEKAETLWYDWPAVYVSDIGECPIFLDALAAQLVRQVEQKHPTLRAQSDKGFFALRHVAMGNKGAADWVDVVAKYGPDRTLNTLRAIVESGVLESHGTDQD